MTRSVTIVVPTLDRPDMLSKTLSFLSNTIHCFPIIVADGSNSDNALRNADACRLAGSHVSYLHLPSPHRPAGVPTLDEHEEILANYMRRYLSALDQVTTPYVVHCGDDDLLIPETVGRCAQFLDHNPDYVACHGVYFHFHYVGNSLKVEYSTYDGPSLDGTELGSRLIQLYWHYESPYAAVFRTAAQRAIIKQAGKLRAGLFSEIFHATASIVVGKIKRLDAIYYFRNVGIASNARPFEDWNQWFVKNFDEFFRHYQEYRTEVIDFSLKGFGANLDADRLRRTIDMAFMVYVGREFHMWYWIAEYLSVAIADQQERDRMGPFLNERLIGQTPMQVSPAAPTKEPVLVSPMKSFAHVRIPPLVQARFSDEQWDLLNEGLNPRPY
jgi:glycosyltransferase domain-containing protein